VLYNGPESVLYVKVGITLNTGTVLTFHIVVCLLMYNSSSHIDCSILWYCNYI